MWHPNLRKKLSANNKKKTLGDRQQITQGEDKKWITFTYHSPLIRKVTNLFKQTNLNIAFKSTNTINQQLSHKLDNTKPSGIHETKCNTCDMVYVGQSGRHITTRHRERTRYIRTNNPNSAYAMHILNNKHEYGTANETLKLLKPCNKCFKMNCWKSFYIQIYRQRDRQITEQLTGDYNPLYKQTYFPHDLQHIPWQSLDQIGTHTHYYTYNNQYFVFRIG